MSNPYQNSFIQSLNPAEIKIIEEHFKKPSTSTEGNRDFKLFKVLSSNPDILFSDKRLFEITGSKGNALRTLKSRMFDKATEALTHDAHIQNELIFNENDRIVFKLRKKFLIYKILRPAITKNNIELLLELLNQIIYMAKEYEIYDVLIDALIAQKYLRGVRYGIEEFNKINREIDFYHYCLKALYFASDCYYHVIINDGLVKSFSKKEINKYILSSIKRMKNDLKKTKSQQINYYIHILQFAYAEQKKNYKNAIDYCNKLLSILKNNKVLYKHERIALAHSNLSHYKTFMGKYTEARTHIKIAKGIYPENSFDHMLFKEQEFYINFYDDKNQTSNDSE